MGKKQNITNEDEMIREMMQSTKIQASENLKFRIMHQIETEKALSPQKVKPEMAKNGGLPDDFRSIFCTMYLLLFGFSLLTIIFGGKETLLSTQFILPSSLIVVTLTAFWALTRLDAHLRKKKKMQ